MTGFLDSLDPRLIGLTMGVSGWFTINAIQETRANGSHA
jgi:hypothetical protein